MKENNNPILLKKVYTEKLRNLISNYFLIIYSTYNVIDLLGNMYR
jgi:hypothetical protein